MAIQTSESVGVAILKALGIETKMVMSVSIDLRPNHIATVTIERALDSEQVGQLVKHLETYDLVRRVEQPTQEAGAEQPTEHHPV